MENIDNDKPICIIEVKENIRRCELGMPLTRSLVILNQSCEFREKFEEMDKIIHREKITEEFKAKKRYYNKKYSKKPGVKEYIKKYHKEYNQRPEVKARNKKYDKEYRQRPEVKARKKEYDQRPDVKAKRKKYEKKYGQKPEVIARKKEYSQRSEVIARRRECYLRKKNEK